MLTEYRVLFLNSYKKDIFAILRIQYYFISRSSDINLSINVLCNVKSIHKYVKYIHIFTV